MFNLCNSLQIAISIFLVSQEQMLVAIRWMGVLDYCAGTVVLKFSTSCLNELKLGTLNTLAGEVSDSC